MTAARLLGRAIGNSEQLRSLTVNTGKFLVDITSTVHAGTSYAYVKFLITRTERTDKRSRISKSDSRPSPGHPNLIRSAHWRHSFDLSQDCFTVELFSNVTWHLAAITN